jgi:uncharacterized coiled-coil DUF342 family protein
MVLKLPPLEFTEALTDSPEFREKLRQHENELENTSNAIKTLIKKLNEVMVANKSMLKNKLELIFFSFFLTNSFIQSIPKCC